MSFIRRKGEKCNKKSPPPYRARGRHPGWVRSTAPPEPKGMEPQGLSSSTTCLIQRIESEVIIISARDPYLRRLCQLGRIMVPFQSQVLLLHFQEENIFLVIGIGEMGKNRKNMGEGKLLLPFYFNAGKISFFFSPPISMEDFCSMRNAREAARGNFLLS